MSSPLYHISRHCTPSQRKQNTHQKSRSTWHLVKKYKAVTHCLHHGLTVCLYQRMEIIVVPGLETNITGQHSYLCTQHQLYCRANGPPMPEKCHLFWGFHYVQYNLSCIYYIIQRQPSTVVPSACWTRWSIWASRFLLAAISDALALSGSYFLSKVKMKNNQSVWIKSITLGLVKILIAIYTVKAAAISDALTLTVIYSVKTTRRGQNQPIKRRSYSRTTI